MVNLPQQYVLKAAFRSNLNDKLECEIHVLAEPNEESAETTDFAKCPRRYGPMSE